MRDRALHVAGDKEHFDVMTRDLAMDVLALLRDAGDSMLLNSRRADALVTISNKGCKTCKPLADEGLRAPSAKAKGPR